ncbi:thermonuclease family protein [Salinibacterium sp. UTAS2018]|uniref:thermonuclease family protein n=1 Tax=Salinibacterium sp. UTAS2018 TaxID=2508880 RepID=UPI001AEFB8D5|nr:thermonuclease family protein [Salinibacterium sp. UTAS2018]
MSAPQKRTRLVGVIIVLALVGGAAAAAYSGATSPGATSDGASLVGSAESSGSASEAPTTSATDTAASEAEATSGNDIPSGAFAATVNYVHDGDTLYLDDGTEELKVRMIGLDTPELASQQQPDAEECYGIEARDLLRDFLPEGTDVWALEDREPEDRYGRSLLYVYLQDGTLVNLAMVELGAAEALKVGLNDRFWPELRDAEDDAYAAKLGMWGAC